MDVSSMASVRKAAQELIEKIKIHQLPLLDAIVCNAGIQFQGKDVYSEEGIEMTFATNCLGHYLLVKLLKNHMNADGRFVFTSSGTHDADTMDGKFVGKAEAPDAFKLANDGKPGYPAISGGKRYTTSKLCLILLTYELNRVLRREKSTLSAIAFDPGFIPETGLTRNAPKIVQKIVASRFSKWVSTMLGVTPGDLQFSGASLGEIATEARFSNSSGKYLQATGHKLSEQKSSVISYDEKVARKLLIDSDELLKTKII
jgi:NAD(P)-dependent dehydrogenase (short-subunit alcohol dehydrogenase family)